MASESIALTAAERSASSPLARYLHDWVVTVDHKKLGILYILYALLFLVIGGIEATIMRIQLIVPHNHFVSPQVFNRMFTMHGTTMIFFVAMPILFGFANYLIPLMIGARDMAFPRLNAWSFWLTAFGGLLLYFSFIGGNGLYGAGQCSRRRVVCLCSTHSQRVLTRAQYRFLDSWPAGLRIWQHWNSGKYLGDSHMLALSRDDARQDAVACLVKPRHGRQWCSWRCRPLRLRR